MKTINQRSFIFTILLTTAAMLGFSQSDAMARHVNSITLAQEEAKSGIQVSGNLSCVLAEANTGSACELRIKESESGAEYRLVDAGSAMQLFFSGKKKISVEGRLDEANVIRVSRAIPL